jgi:ubiquinone/menaquinone biosynthesis C-methylase UbiE
MYDRVAGMHNTDGVALFKEFELAGWDRSVDAYSNSFAPLTFQAGRCLVDRLEMGKEDDVFDSACGPGTITALIASRCRSVIGGDFSPNMIALARKLHQGLSFDVQDAEGLTYVDRSFDVISMNFGLLHLAAPERAIAEAARVLRPGGRFGFTVWAPPSESLGFAVVLEAIDLYGDPRASIPPGPPFFTFSDPAVTGEHLRAHSFSQLRTHKVELVWELPSPEALFDAFLYGAVRTGGMLRAQPEDKREAIRAHVIREAAERFGGGKTVGVRVPMSAMVYTASR